MAFTLSPNLRLRLDTNLTANSRFNLLKLDELGAVYTIDNTGTVLVRSKLDLQFSADDPSVGGSGSGGNATFGSSSQHLASFNVWADSVNFNGASGVVSSVGLAAPVSIFSVSGSPVTSSGTLTLSLVNQSAATFWAGPTSGPAAAPSFRAIQASDLPAGIGFIQSVSDSANIHLAVSANNLTANVIAGSLTNAEVSPSAAIAYSKLALSNSIVNSDISSSAAISYSKLNLTGDIVNSDVSASAAIQYSKLSLTNSIVNADVASGAAIAYSKLNLTGALVDSDVSASANILLTKTNLHGLTLKATPSISDEFLIYDVTGLSNKKATIGSILGSTSFTTTWSSGTSFSFTHNLGTENVNVGVYDLNNGSDIGLESVTRTDANNITLTSTEAPTGAGWEVVVLSAGSAVIAGGTVTSVALSTPASILTVSGSPITTAGTLTLSLANQAANEVWAGPTSGPSAAPSFRALVASDIPSLPYQPAFTPGSISTSTSGMTVGNGSSSTVGPNVTINVQTASGSQPGLLSAADWNTFNSKQAAGSYITALTGDVTATGPGSVAATIANGAVTSAKIASGAVSLTSQVSGVLPTANGGTGQVSTATFPTSGVVVTEAGSETLTNKTMSGAVNTFTNIPLASAVSGILPIVNGGTNSSLALSNNRVMQSSGGAIVEAAAITAHRAIVSDANGIPTHSATTDTEISYVSGVTSAIQTQLNAKLTSSLSSGQVFIGNGSNVAMAQTLSGDITNDNTGVVTIANGAITNAKVSNTAAIAYSKLNLTGNIVNADIAAGAAIAGSKISPNFGAQNISTTGTDSAASYHTTGTAGAGFLALNPQSAYPTAPASGAQIFSDNANRPGWMSTSGNAANWDLSGLSTNRVFTLPDLSDTVVTLSATQTLTNKTIVPASNTISLTSTHLLVGNGSNVATDVALSGDATLANTGALTVANNAISNSKLAQAPANTLKGNNTGSTANVTDLTTTQVNTLLGTITSLTGEATASGPGAAATTLSNAAVIGKVLTGYAYASGTVAATDSILGAIQKVDANTTDGYFGDGSDGVVSLSSGTTTLAQDMFYSNLTITGTASINTNGYRIYVNGILDLSNAPANAIQWFGLAGGSSATTGAGAQPANTASETVGNGARGSVGKAGGTAAGTNGTAGVSASPANGGRTSSSGAGGAGTGGAGGAAATGPAVAVTLPIRRYAQELNLGLAQLGGGNSGPSGGSGGGDGAAGGGSGAGGSGGNVVYIAARTIKRGASTTASAISAAGGAGGNGGTPAAGTRGGGGGGSGGGGGWIYIAYRDLQGSAATNMLDASGGAGGSGGNGTGGQPGGNGGSGGDGGSITLFNVLLGSGSNSVGPAGSSGNAASGSSGGSGGAGGQNKVTL